MRSELLYLTDLIHATDAIAGYVSGFDRDGFLADDLVRCATIYRLIPIGEAAARLSAELKARHPGLPWSDIVGFRNITVHGYFGTNWEIVWDAATANAPALRTAVLAIIAAEFPEGVDTPGG